MFGIDYAWTHVPVSAMKARGVQFVMRYLSTDASKSLSAREAAALHAAGIKIGVVWETVAMRMTAGHAAGVADAHAAAAQARACGLGTVPIYFAADWDETPSQQDEVNGYLDGAAEVLGRDHVGVYGGFWPLSRARKAGKAAYYWGTIAWSGSNWATCGWRPHIMQGLQITVGGVACDPDTGLAGDIGLWPRPAVPPPAPAPKPPHALKPVPEPAVLVQADGRTSLLSLAQQYEGLDSWDLVLCTARCKAPGEDWGPLQHHYLTVRDFTAPMPAGMVIMVGHPGA